MALTIKIIYCKEAKREMMTKEYEQHERLLESSRKHKEEGNVKEALNDVMSALKIEDSPAGSQLLKELIKESSSKTGPNLISNLLLALQSNNSQGSEALDAATKLASLPSWPGLSNNLHLVSSSYFKADTPTRVQLILLLSRLSLIDDFSLELLQIFSSPPPPPSSSSDFNSWFSDSANLALIIANTIATYGVSKSFNLTLVKPLLTKFYELCGREDTVEYGRVQAFKSLMKVFVNNEIVNDFLPNLALITHLVGSASERQLCTAFLVSAFRFVDEDQKRIVVNAIYERIEKLFLSHTAATEKGLWTLSVLFQANATFGAAILMREGFLAGILDVLEFEKEEFQFATMELLSSACNSNEARTLISVQASELAMKFCGPQYSKRLQLVSLTILIKVLPVNVNSKKFILAGDFGLNFLKSLIISDPSLSGDALEALSYICVFSSIKDKLVDDAEMISTIFDFVLRKTEKDLSLNYAIATIFSNITAYPKEVSQEKEQLRKLHALANAEEGEDSGNDIASAEKRCTKLMAFPSFLRVIMAIDVESPNTQAAVSLILYALAYTKDRRGFLVQAGACTLLIKLSNSKVNGERLIAAQALAKITITSNPHTAFKGEISIELVRPLLLLLKNGGQLAQFESLMGLTNLLGVNESFQSKCFNLGGLEMILEAQFSDHFLIKRAATEALCNFIFHPIVFGKFMMENSQLLQIMVALSDDDDAMTRRAASGAVAILSSVPEALPLIVNQARFEEIFLSLLKSDNPELSQRALAVVKNLNAAGQCSVLLLDTARSISSSSFE